jgi:hypothetical protein
MGSTCVRPAKRPNHAHPIQGRGHAVEQRGQELNQGSPVPCYRRSRTPKGNRVAVHPNRCRVQCDYFQPGAHTHSLAHPQCVYREVVVSESCMPVQVGDRGLVHVENGILLDFVASCFAPTAVHHHLLQVLAGPTVTDLMLTHLTHFSPLPPLSLACVFRSPILCSDCFLSRTTFLSGTFV